MPNSKTAVEIIYGARELLAVPLCWMRGDYCDGDLSGDDCWQFSVAGALMVAGGVDKVSLFTGISDAFFDAILAVAMEIGQPVTVDAPDAVNQAINRIETWNDAPQRKHADVLDLLERAHALLLSVA